MKFAKSLFAPLCAFAYLFTTPLVAQEKEKMAEGLQAELAGTWDVVVDQVNEDYRLKIQKVLPRSGDEFTVEAEYGSPGKESSVTSAELIQAGKERRLSFTTRAGAKVLSTQTNQGQFVGTLAFRSYPALAVTITKLAGPAIRIYPTVERASADVPKECAAFLGGWTGTWGVSGRVWLWVTSVDAKCNAKYAYVNTAYPRFFKTAEIKGGVLEAPVPRGVNYFRFDGDKLYDRYVGGGVDDTLQFSRVDVAVAPIDSAQAAATVIVKPGSDVPGSCASFSGRWSGAWGYGIGRQWLWVASVDAKCSAKIAYLANGDVPSAFQTIDIKDGTLSIPCGGTDTCKFSVHGDELNAAAYGATGANNNAVFKKIP